YNDLIIAMQTQDSVVPFEELFDKIIDHETFLIHNEKKNLDSAPPTVNIAKHSPPSHYFPKPNFPSSAPCLFPNPSSPIKPYTPNQPTSTPIVCQFCNKRRHDAKKCYKLFPHLYSQRPSANHVTTSSSAQNPWIVDSGASHHVIFQMLNLSLHQPYEGPDDIQIGDGSGLQITHTGSVSFSPSFNLSNILCVPLLNKI
ncbi:hypothetical protein TorRG33x02_168330, partial [Trema orientale]